MDDFVEARTMAMRGLLIVGLHYMVKGPNDSFLDSDKVGCRK